MLKSMQWQTTTAILLCKLFLSATVLLAQTNKNVQYNTNDFAFSPRYLMKSNVIAGTGISISTDTRGRVTVTSTGTNTESYITAPTNGVAPPPEVIQPVGHFGSMMYTTTNYTYGAQNTYVIVTNYSTVRTNGVYANPATGFLTNSEAGFYRITAYVSALPGNSEMLEGELFVNGTGREEIAFFGQWDNPARIRTIATSGILYLPANSGISLRLKNLSATNTAAIWRASLTIGTP